jgi:hypothetical protein
MISVRFAFVNDMGVMGHVDPIDIPNLPKIGDFIFADEMPEALVLHIFIEEPPQDVLDFVQMYGNGYDGLPLIICQTPDGWTPLETSQGHTLQ